VEGLKFRQLARLIVQASIQTRESSKALASIGCSRRVGNCPANEGRANGTRLPEVTDNLIFKGHLVSSEPPVISI